MPGTAELMARLQQLEDGYYGDKEAARQQKFMDTYGSRFSNNRGLGMAILNELDARGIDTSAADEAVQQILDQLRTECNEIIESIKEEQQKAIETAQKVEEIGNVVSEVVAGNPSAESMNIPTGSPSGAELPPDMMDAEEPNFDVLDENGEPIPEEGGEPIPEEGGEPIPEEGGEPIPEEGGEPIPEEGGEPIPEEGGEPMPEPNTQLSDARMKRIKNCFSAVRSRKARNSYKPSAGILAAAQRGI